MLDFPSAINFKTSLSREVSGSVSISENTGNISFSIEDDGIGFDEGLIDAKGIEARGLGLETMKGRCRMVGGVLKIWTKEGEGTRITLSVPVQRGTTQ